MLTTKYLIIGAGISGLAFSNFIKSNDYLILEKENAIGGWCKTVYKDGFVWDYSGHFFHFKHPEIEQYLRARMPTDGVVTVKRCAKILFEGNWIDFPFQKNIHQLPREAFIDCLYDLYFREESTAEFHVDNETFKGMLYEKFGRSISEKFLIPYNEKLYACDLESLDRDAMGRFFPHADLGDIIRNMRHTDNTSYNATFTYPRDGAIMYVNALKEDVADDRILFNEKLTRIDLLKKIAHTASGQSIRFEHLISSAPFNHLLRCAGLSHSLDVFRSNKVLVFNMGFDSKGLEGVHWVYFPERKYCFYRVGFYDNILASPRMSLYVEIGYPPDEAVDVESMRQRVLNDLTRSGLIMHQKLVADHHVVLDPAYVHITRESKGAFDRLSATLALQGVHSIGRYGGWTYCSIEDNIVEARDLAQRFNMIAEASAAR